MLPVSRLYPEDKIQQAVQQLIIHQDTRQKLAILPLSPSSYSFNFGISRQKSCLKIVLSCKINFYLSFNRGIASKAVASDPLSVFLAWVSDRY